MFSYQIVSTIYITVGYDVPSLISRLVFPYTFGHTSECNCVALGLPTAIQCVVKNSVLYFIVFVYPFIRIFSVDHPQVGLDPL